MSWSYSGNPSDSDKDEVRFLIGDTDTNDQQVTDEEIAWALTQGGTYMAAAIIADALVAKYSRKADKAVDSLKISWSQLSEHYRSLADDLRLKASTADGITPFAGGISVSGKQAEEADTDRVKPNLFLHIDDNKSC